MPKYPKKGYTERVSRNTIRVFQGIERVNLMHWEYRKFRRCALCGAEEWIPVGEENERGWGFSELLKLRWDYCPRHLEDGRELTKTLYQTLRQDAREIYQQVAARVSKRDGEPHRPWVIEEKD